MERDRGEIRCEWDRVRHQASRTWKESERKVHQLERQKTKRQRWRRVMHKPRKRRKRLRVVQK